jgi:glycosyltransferase involved in cell wall biosynthesis
MARNTSQGLQADVCLVLEGGFPEATGGVSVWVRELTRNLPEVRFTIANLRHDGDPSSVTPREAGLADNVTAMVDVPVEADREAVTGRLPEAGIYHACLTGHASDAAAQAADETGRPMLLTEHGLAWREAGWITGCNPHGQLLPRAQRARRVHRVGAQARAAYARADVITSVCSANLAAQRRMGAPKERSLMIPNAAPGASLSPQPRAGSGEDRFTVGFVGRVVQIKDLLTLVRAAALVRASLPAADFVIVGPLDHDPAYAERCQELARSLDLGDAVRFVGEADPADWYPRFDAVVLTSRSEAQPLVLLEAMAAGLPTVATRVGGCAELLVGEVRGRREAPAGLLVSPGDEQSVAEAILALGRDPELRRRLGAAGRERARQHHHPAEVWGTYRALYDRVAA